MAQGLAPAMTAETTAEYPDRFTRLVRQHQSMVFSIAYACLRNRPMAEDIAQDVFLALYRKLPALETDSHVVNWLRRVTSHRMIDEVRERKRKPQAALEDVREPSATPNPGDPLLSEALQQLVSTLPERARLIMILRFQEEMELSEIAETLEMPVGTVKSRLQRSLALLRDKMTRREITR